LLLQGLFRILTDWSPSRGQMRFLRPLFKVKNPLFDQESDCRLLIWPFEVLFDADSKKWYANWQNHVKLQNLAYLRTTKPDFNQILIDLAV